MQRLPNDLLRLFATQITSKAFYGIVCSSRSLSKCFLQERTQKVMRQLFSVVRETRRMNVLIEFTTYTPNGDRNGDQWVYWEHSDQVSRLHKFVQYKDNHYGGIYESYDSDGSISRRRFYRDNRATGYDYNYTTNMLTYWKDDVDVLTIRHNHLTYPEIIKVIESLMKSQ